MKKYKLFINTYCKFFETREEMTKYIINFHEYVYSLSAFENGKKISFLTICLYILQDSKKYKIEEITKSVEGDI